MPLSVAGAFHTEYMALGPRESCGRVVGGLPPGRPQPLLLSNADGAAVDTRRRGAVAGWSARSPARCASTRAWPPCASSGSPPSSSCRRPARWPGWPSASGRAPRHRDARARQPGRPRPRPRAARPSAAAPRPSTARLAGRRLPGPRHGQPAPRSPRAATSPAGSPLGCIRSRREEVDVSPATTAYWPSGSSTTATSSTPGPDRPSLPGGRSVSTDPAAGRRRRRTHPRPGRLPAPAPGDQRRSSPRSWTPTTSGSRAGSASPSAAGPSEDETLVEMAVAAGGKALAASGLSPRRDRPGHRGQRQPAGPQSRASARRSRTGWASPGPAPSTSTPAAPGSATRSASRPTASAPGSARNALVVGVERLTDVTDLEDRGDRGDLRRRRRRRRGRRRRRARHRPGRLGQRRRPAQRHRDRRRPARR